MSAASAAARVMALGMLILSGGYTLVYLARWEWNRALIAAVFFLAAEIALVGMMVLRRLQRVELATRASLERAGPDATTERTQAHEHFRRVGVDRPNPFAWLHGSQMSVFVPVLLGAGAVLSAAAYVVQRLAEATAIPLVDHDLANRLTRLAPPEGGLLAQPSEPAVVDRAPRPRLPRLVAKSIGAATLLAVVIVGVRVLADATQSRPGGTRAASSEFVLDLQQAGPAAGWASDASAAEALWFACRNAISTRESPDVVVASATAGRARITLTPGLSELQTRRFHGCLEDMTVARLQAAVVSVIHHPR